MNDVSRLEIGTVQFGKDYGISNEVGRVDYKEVEKILRLSVKNNIYTLDTAKSYGNSESVIGRYVKQNPDLNWDIITKVNDEKDFCEEIKDSIKKLNIKKITVLAHSPKVFLKDKFHDKVKSAKSEGMIKKFGVSVYSSSEIYELLEKDLKPDIVQLPLNILDTRIIRNGFFDELYLNNIEIHARSIFLQGLFYLSNKKLEKNYPDAVFSINKLREIASKNNLSLAELSLLWVFSLKKISKIIIGVESSIQLKIILHCCNAQ